MPKLKYDIQCENFEHFFAKEAAGMQENQRELLPKELLFKLFTKGYRVNTKSSSKLSLVAKLFVLFRSLRKRWILIVEDDENGMNEEEYFKMKKLTSKQDYGQDNANELISHGTFVLGCSELVNTYGKLNSLSTSPAYNYLTKSKNKDYLRPDDYIRDMNYINRFLSNYEANRKRITMNTGLSMADWLVLTHIYHGNLVDSSPIYKEFFKYSYNTSATKIKQSFSSLQTRGLIEKTGVTKGAKIRITSLGKDKINQLVSKYVVNC